MCAYGDEAHKFIDVSVCHLSNGPGAMLKAVDDLTEKKLMANLRYRDTRKHKVYDVLTANVGSSMTPFVMSTYGVFHPDALQLLKNIGKSVAEAIGTTAFNPTAWFHKTLLHLSVTLQKFNARAILTGLHRAKKNAAIRPMRGRPGARKQKQKQKQKQKKKARVATTGSSNSLVATATPFNPLSISVLNGLMDDCA